MTTHATSPRFLCSALLTTFVALYTWNTDSAADELPVQAGKFPQAFHRAYTSADGLPADGVSQVAFNNSGDVFAKSTSHSVYQLQGDHWIQVNDSSVAGALFGYPPSYPGLGDKIASVESVRDVSVRGDEVAVAANEGLYLGDGRRFRLALPQQGSTRWAPVDVRAVVFDRSGKLWFAAPQGVGFRQTDGSWQLHTGAEGLPYNDFTCAAAGPDSVWFGTTNGAIRYQDGKWSFRQGRRWLVDNYVRDIAVDSGGRAWVATAEGISCLADKPMTLAKKAAYYEEEIEKYNRRTQFGYVNPANLSSPGDKSTARPTYSDNDGFNTGLYLAAVSLGYTTDRDPQLKRYADNAFKALRFLSDVTQGGEHPAPRGFVARNVVPTTEVNPNERYDLDYDIRRQKRDSLWKIMRPRVPVDKTGNWYWKCDSSSDELDGHFFGCAVYFDHICQTEQQKKPVRRVIRDIIEHLLTHDYTLIDHDGKPTRWAHFAPDDLNKNPSWVAERGMNSYAILTYLTIAHHITGDQKYRDIFMKLALDEGYGMNGMSQYKWIPGSHSPGHQPGDNLSFMNYYHLLRYETDPRLLSMFYFAITKHWSFEKYERNAFTNFVYGACCQGRTRTDNWGRVDVSPPMDCYTDAVDTLKRYPLDLVEWPMSNAHRTDMRPLEGQDRQTATIGSDIHGYAFPIDERTETYWDWDPWRLRSDKQGLVLRPGFHYLLAYYLGRFHGFIADTSDSL